MKRVICLYRVSTVGQVDHDDIPMQKLACREYAASHPDWEIVDEISEKGISGYKVSTNDRDAIVEIKKRAIMHKFDVLKPIAATGKSPHRERVMGKAATRRLR